MLLQFTTVKAHTLNEISALSGIVTLGEQPTGTNACPIKNTTGFMPTVKLAEGCRVKAINQLDSFSGLSDPFKIVFEYSDLEILKKSEQRSIVPNEAFEYEITVENKGNADNTNVSMVDVLPTNLTFLSIVSVSHGNALHNNGQIEWTIPLLRDKERAVLFIKVLGEVAGKIINTAKVSGDLHDPKMDNNTAVDFKNIISNIKIPNVITPNGDGKNDALIIEGTDLYKENILAIFNRWGNQVYRSAGGYNNTWSGEGLSEGTYYYVLKLVSTEGKLEQVTGWITLLRNK